MVVVSFLFGFFFGIVLCIEVAKMVAEDEKKEIVDALIEVYNSFISSKIDDYNSSVYYENPNYIFECYKEKKMI